MQSFKQFIKKPVKVKAVLWNGENLDVCKKFLGADFIKHHQKTNEIEMKTLEDGQKGQAKHVASLNDYIVRGVDGEFYPCKGDIFKKTYKKSDGKEIKKEDEE